MTDEARLGLSGDSPDGVLAAAFDAPGPLIAAAKSVHRPVVTVCLFSGGNDSTVLAHRCRDHYDVLAFIDTGTAIPGVREFVGEFAEWVGKPLKIVEARDAYRHMVLGTGPPRTRGEGAGTPSPALGFPGPGQHGRAYNRLKERSLERLLRDLKQGHPRSARVLGLTGVRRAESARREKRMPLTRRGSLAFCNPLIDWTDEQMRAYRQEHELPQSDVAALIHRSGECNCGAFAAPGEREMMQSLWPEWSEATIASLEREAEARGIPHCRWGVRPGKLADDAGPLCSDCQLRIELPDEEAA